MTDEVFALTKGIAAGAVLAYSDLTSHNTRPGACMRLEPTIAFDRFSGSVETVDAMQTPKRFPTHAGNPYYQERRLMVRHLCIA
jgi:hypothetical protein